MLLNMEFLRIIWAYLLPMFWCLHISHGHKVCYGTTNGLSKGGYSIRNEYRHLRERYTGCTYVHGNLEITHLTPSPGFIFDLSFLATIRVVSGYVLLAVNTVDVIPLTGLVYVRGDNVFKHDEKEYSMFLALNFVPEGIWLPELKQINGNVGLIANEVCYLHTVIWNDIVKDGFEMSLLTPEAPCGQCSSKCPVTKGGRHCWGPGGDTCQAVSTVACDWLCRNTTCLSEGMLGCCHPQCVGGCTDSWIDTACHVCRNFNYEGHCVEECPMDTTYYSGQDCISIKDSLLKLRDF